MEQVEKQIVLLNRKIEALQSSSSNSGLATLVGALQSKCNQIEIANHELKQQLRVITGQVIELQTQLSNHL